MSNNTLQNSPSQNITGLARLYYIDWLRFIAIIAIFLFHNSRFFDIEPWHVNNAETSTLATLFVGFINQWTMALFFVMAGASTFFCSEDKDGSPLYPGKISALVASSGGSGLVYPSSAAGLPREADSFPIYRFFLSVLRKLFQWLLYGYQQPG